MLRGIRYIMKTIQWFPGHMTKAMRMMKENAALCDGAQSLRPEVYDDLAHKVRSIREVLAK